MAVRPRHGGWQADACYRGRRARAQFATEAEAQVWTREAEAALREGRAVPPARPEAPVTGVPTLAEAIEAVAAAPAQAARMGGWAGTKDAARSIRHAYEVADKLGGRQAPLPAVTSKALAEAAEAFRREGLSGASINRRMAAISKVVRFHARQGADVRLPVLPRFREAEPRKRVFSEAEVRRLVAALEEVGHPDTALLARAAHYTAARFGELASLRWRDIDFDARAAVFPADITKPGHIKALPLPRPLLMALEPLRGRPEDLVFGRVCYRTANNRLREAARRAGVTLGPGDGWHTFRRTTATALLRGGMDVAKVQRMLGHRSIATTLRYTQIVVEDLRPAEDILASV